LTLFYQKIDFIDQTNKRNELKNQSIWKKAPKLLQLVLRL